MECFKQSWYNLNVVPQVLDGKLCYIWEVMTPQDSDGWREHDWCEGGQDFCNDEELYMASYIYEAFSYSVYDVKTEHPCHDVLHALWYSQYVQSPHGKAKYHHTAVGVEHYGGWYLDLQ